MSPREAEGKLNDVVPTGLAGRILVPPLVAFLLLSAYVVAEALGFRGLARPEAATVAEAAALGHAARTLQLIAEGQDPNEPTHLRAGFLDAREYDVRPLEAAILARHAELVRLLLRSDGAHFDTSRAVCFARARLPDVLPDLGASITESAEPAEIAVAFTMCGTD